MIKQIIKGLSWIVWSCGPIDDPVRSSRPVSREVARRTPCSESLLIFLGLVTKVCPTPCALKQYLFNRVTSIKTGLHQSPMFASQSLVFHQPMCGIDVSLLNSPVSFHDDIDESSKFSLFSTGVQKEIRVTTLGNQRWCST